MCMALIREVFNKQKTTINKQTNHNNLILVLVFSFCFCFLFFVCLFACLLLEGWNSSVDQRARRNDDASSTPRCSRGPFSQSQFSVQTLL